MGEKTIHEEKLNNNIRCMNLLKKLNRNLHIKIYFIQFVLYECQYVKILCMCNSEKKCNHYVKII